MILCGCLGLGMWYRGQFLMRLHMTRELICLLDQWISEIRYNRSTLPEGCRQIGRPVSITAASTSLTRYVRLAYLRAPVGRDL